MLRRGQYEIAHDCFRASLELKLAHDRMQVERQLNPLHQVRSVSPECVSIAEEHLMNLSNYLTEGASRRSSSASSDDEEMEDRTPRPYIYAEGFVMPDESRSTVQLRSCMNVFNLGLIHQMKEPAAEKARDFYRIAATLLALDTENRHSALIRLAVANNFGVWCHENGDAQQARECMEQVATLLERLDESLSPEALNGFQSNIQMFSATR